MALYPIKAKSNIPKSVDANHAFHSLHQMMISHPRSSGLSARARSQTVPSVFLPFILHSQYGRVRLRLRRCLYRLAMEARLPHSTAGRRFILNAFGAGRRRVLKLLKKHGAAEGRWTRRENGGAQGVKQSERSCLPAIGELEPRHKPRFSSAYMY
jgi:hypothetical protein